NEIGVVQDAPNYTFTIRSCPWKWQFDKMGSTLAGMVYCTHLDNSICMGFNPYLTYEVDLSQLEDEGYCIHSVHSKSKPNIDNKTYTKHIMNFEYHCAHLYWSFHEVLTSIFRLKGEEVATYVLNDFGDEYGNNAMIAILKYRHTNFNVIY